MSRTIRITPALVLFALAFSALPLHAAPSADESLVARARYVMGSRCVIRASGSPEEAQRAIDAAFARIETLERVMTTWDEEGELARLNARLQRDAGPITVSSDLISALGEALDWAGRTGGRFDPTIGPLLDAWSHAAGTGEPDAESLASARAHTSWQLVRTDRATREVTARRAGLRLDLGGFGKGFAIDAAAAVLREHGVERALIDFGGQVTAIGAPRGTDGWPVAIADPLDRTKPVLTVSLRDATLATSSNVLRRLGDEGQGAGHVLDPRSGRPVDGLGAVSVIASRATVADALSTALLVASHDGRGFPLPAGVEMLRLVPALGPGGGLSATGTGRFALLAPLARSGPAAAPAILLDGDADGTDDAGGESQPADERGARIDELERQVTILAEEIERLRSGGVADQPAPLGEVERRRPAATKVYRAGRGMSFGGYGEWIYENFATRDDAGAVSGKTDRADFLRLVLYAGYKFDERFVFNSEIELEHGSTSGDGEVSVEFAHLDIFVTPGIAVRTGMILVPVGLVNEMHEPPTFLGARRPDVERSILPTTWRELGTGVTGSAGRVEFDAYLVTGLDGSGFTAADGLRGGRQKGSKASADDLAVTGRVRIADVPGLVAGVSGFHGAAGQGATVAGRALEGNVTTWDAHVDWISDVGLELRGLWTRVEVDDAEGYSTLSGETIGSRMSGWYAQAGFDVLSRRDSTHRLIPFVRIEELDTQERVPAALAGTVTGENDRDVFTLGVSWKPRENVAFKIDWQDHDNRAGTGVDQLNVAAGLYF